MSHTKLLSVLKSNGIANNNFNWMHAFITNSQCQFVCINNALSSFLPVTSGVSQGSVLGPLMFLIFIKNLTVSCYPKHADSGKFLYADDAKLFSTDSNDLQQSLTSVVCWMEFYQLSLAPAKCQHLPIICHPDTDKASNQYYIVNQKISSLSKVCDLGVVISSNLKWHQHVSSIVSKAFICSHQTLHCFSSNNVWILLKAYVTYIRPLLEYSNVIWSLFLKSEF